MEKFSARLEIIGVNPFVYLPDKILKAIFKQAGKEKGHIPIKGSVNKKPYNQTLVKFAGQWRLYINTSMLKNSPKRVGEKIFLTVEFDPVPREITPHPKLTQALNNNEAAKIAFNALSPSRQKEIVRYISNLKTEDSVIRNVSKAISHLLGKERFIGRSHE